MVRLVLKKNSIEQKTYQCRNMETARNRLKREARHLLKNEGSKENSQDKSLSFFGTEAAIVKIGKISYQLQIIKAKKEEIQMEKMKLLPYPFCGKEVEIHTHPEWNERGKVFGALIHHSDCVDGMEVGQYSVHKQKTEEDAYNVLAAAWNKRADVKAVSNENIDRIL